MKIFNLISNQANKELECQWDTTSYPSDWQKFKSHHTHYGEIGTCNPCLWAYKLI